MTDATGLSSEDRPTFSATITPSAGLRPRGVALVIGLIGSINLVSGVVFWIAGAWPVSGFLGLDVVAVWLAFRAYRRQSRSREEIRITPDEIVILRVSARGARETVRLNPYWVRLKRHVLEDEGLVRIEFVSHGRGVTIGRMLSPPEREDLAAALDGALRAAREAC